MVEKEVFCGQVIQNNIKTKITLIHTFLAPELLEGSKNSKESDVYAFGLVCFELTKHTKPWHDEHIGTAILQVVAGK